MILYFQQFMCWLSGLNIIRAYRRFIDVPFEDWHQMK